MKNILSGADWIWFGNASKPNLYVNFYEILIIEENESDNCTKYKLFISADSQYVIYINGEFSGICGQYADYPRYKIYDEHDISPFLKSGENKFLLRKKLLLFSLLINKHSPRRASLHND